MAKVFYDHLVLIEEITAELDAYSLPKEERAELLQLIDENIHHRVLDTILQHLPPQKHEHFLTKFHRSPHDQKLLEYLKQEINADIEEKIKEEAKKIKSDLLSEIKRARRK